MAKKPLGGRSLRPDRTELDHELGLQETNGALVQALPFQLTVRLHMKKTQTKNLIDSKWTDLDPVEREKHFIVTRIVSKSKSNNGTAVSAIELRAVISKRSKTIPENELNDPARWSPGWK